MLCAVPDEVIVPPITMPPLCVVAPVKVEAPVTASVPLSAVAAEPFTARPPAVTVNPPAVMVAPPEVTVNPVPAVMLWLAVIEPDPPVVENAPATEEVALEVKPADMVTAPERVDVLATERVPEPPVMLRALAMPTVPANVALPVCAEVPVTENVPAAVRFCT